MNNIKKNIIDIANEFSSVNLDQLDSYQLINRYDVKYVINIKDLPTLLQSIKSDYQILENRQQRMFSYNNLYFDTKEYYFYNQHHNGKLNRSKIRFREYVDSGLYFFEIKSKKNNNKTSKERIRTNKIDTSLSTFEKDFILYHLNINPKNLYPKLFINYNRMTFVRINGTVEKVTIDTDISFNNTIDKTSLPEIAIIEVKQKKFCKLTYLYKQFKTLNILFGTGFSKYCLGLSLVDTNVKYNRFKPKILFINKLLSINE